MFDENKYNLENGCTNEELWWRNRVLKCNEKKKKNVESTNCTFWNDLSGIMKSASFMFQILQAQWNIFGIISIFQGNAGPNKKSKQIKEILAFHFILLTGVNSAVYV